MSGGMVVQAEVEKMVSLVLVEKIQKMMEITVQKKKKMMDTVIFIM